MKGIFYDISEAMNTLLQSESVDELAEKWKVVQAKLDAEISELVEKDKAFRQSEISTKDTLPRR